MKFCIKKLNVEFKKISEDLYSIIDLSEYDYDNINDVLGFSVEIKISTPSEEEFLIMMNCGSGSMFSLKDKKLFAIEDGQYCISTKSCGASIKKLVGYYPNIKEKIDGLIMTTDDKKYMKLIFEQFQIMKVLDEHDNKKDAKRIYEDISDLLEKCRPGEKCYR